MISNDATSKVVASARQLYKNLDPRIISNRNSLPNRETWFNMATNINAALSEPSYLTNQICIQEESEGIARELAQDIDLDRQQAPLGRFKQLCLSLDSIFTWQEHAKDIEQNYSSDPNTQDIIGRIKTKVNQVQERIMEIVYDTATIFGAGDASKTTKLAKTIDNELITNLHFGSRAEAQNNWKELIEVLPVAA